MCCNVRMGADLQPRPFFTDDGRGEPILLLHAFPLDGRMWEAQRGELSRGGGPESAPTSSRFRIVVPDLAGFGRSADVPTRATLDAHAGDVALLLDTLAIERATIVGSSMGGYIALAFARRYPDRL